MKIDISMAHQPPNLVPYLESVEKGSPSVLYTHVCDNLVAATDILDQIARDVEAHLSVTDVISDEVREALIEAERAQALKQGPLSVRSPWSERVDQLNDYYQPRERNLKWAESYEWLPQSRLRLATLEKAADNMVHDTNSGLPYFKKRRLVLDDDLKLASAIAKELRSTGNGVIDVPPAIIGWRGQMGSSRDERGIILPKSKERTVWMFPQSLNIVETSIFLPARDAILKAYPGVLSAWTHLNEVDRKVTDLFKSGNIFLSSDFSSYDASLIGLWNRIVPMVTRLFQNQDKLLIANLIGAISNIGILTPDGVKTGHHGMPSGSSLTNFIDTLWHMHMIYQYVGTLDNALVQGDDGVIAFNHSGDPENYMQFITENYGMAMNPTKQVISDNHILYLQRHHFRSYVVNGMNVGSYPINRMVALLFRERTIDPELWDMYMESVRELMIAENAKYHPSFDSVVLPWLVKLDPYLKSRNHLLRLVGAARKASKITAFTNSYSQKGELLRGLENTIVYKKLMERAN